MNNWYAVLGESLEEVKDFGTKFPSNFNSDYLVYDETPEKAFKSFFTRKSILLELKLARAKELAALYN